MPPWTKQLAVRGSTACQRKLLLPSLHVCRSQSLRCGLLPCSFDAVPRLAQAAKRVCMRECLQMLHLWAGAYIPPDENAEMIEVEDTKLFVCHRFAKKLGIARIPFKLASGLRAFGCNVGPSG